MRRIGFRMVVAAVALAVLAACQSTYRPATGPNQLGTMSADIGRERVAGGILPACRASGRTAESRERVRSAIASWYEVMRHLDHCDLSRLRYYTGPQYEAALRGHAQRLAASPRESCARQAAAMDARLAQSFGTLRAWTDANLTYCTLPQEMVSLRTSSVPLPGLRADLDRQFARLVDDTFAGLGVAALPGR